MGSAAWLLHNNQWLIVDGTYIFSDKRVSFLYTVQGLSDTGVCEVCGTGCVGCPGKYYPFAFFLDLRIFCPFYKQNFLDSLFFWLKT